MGAHSWRIGMRGSLCERSSGSRNLGIVVRVGEVVSGETVWEVWPDHSGKEERRAEKVVQGYKRFRNIWRADVDVGQF